MPGRQSGSGIRPGGGGGTPVSSLPLFSFGRVVSSVDPRLVPGVGGWGTSNHAKGCRVVIPVSGVLKGFSILVGTASGNCEGFILDTAATTRNRLWSSGSVAMAGVNAWQALGDPNITVTAGQHVDFCITVDNTSGTVGRTAIISNMGILPAAFPAQAPAGGANNLVWDAAQTIPVGTTVLESGMAGTSICVAVACYIV